jgi:dynein heavy chain 2
MLDFKFETTNISRDYSLKEFKRDLKSIMIQAGIEGENIVLYLEDHQMLESEFYEYLNSLISAGEIPGLYTSEELEPLLINLQDEMKNQYE